MRAGLIAVGLMAAGGARAEPFSVQADGTGSAWVIDEATGATRLCRSAPATGSEVLDVFGAGADARPGMARAARPYCVVALRPLEEPAAAPARGMLGDGSSGPRVGSGVGMLGNGGYGFGDAPENQVVIVRPGAVSIGLY